MVFQIKAQTRKIIRLKNLLFRNTAPHIMSGIAMRAFTFILASLLFHIPAEKVSAATADSSFTVRIVIGAACIITSNTDMLFGNAGVLASAIDQTTTINVQCTTGQAYNIGLDKGVHGASVSTRQMSGPGGLINYSLSSDAGRTVNWGATAGSDTVNGVGTGAVQSYTVYGRGPAQATPAPGTYSDTVAITVTY